MEIVVWEDARERCRYMYPHDAKDCNENNGKLLLRYDHCGSKTKEKVNTTRCDGTILIIMDPPYPWDITNENPGNHFNNPYYINESHLPYFDI